MLKFNRRVFDSGKREPNQRLECTKSRISRVVINLGDQEAIVTRWPEAGEDSPGGQGRNILGVEQNATMFKLGKKEVCLSKFVPHRDRHGHLFSESTGLGVYSETHVA